VPSLGQRSIGAGGKIVGHGFLLGQRGFGDVSESWII